MQKNPDIFIALFEKNVLRSRDKIAISDPETDIRVTYGELDIMARRIASKLQEHGIQKGDAVAIVLPHSIEFLASMLAAMKIGAVFVPLNENYPAQRLQYIFEDCGANAVITPDFFEGLTDCPPIQESTKLRPEDAAILIYTSGSTGNPKGVCLSHQAVLKGVQRLVQGAELKEEDVFGLGAPFFFIAGAQVAFAGLGSGMTTFLVSMSAMRDPLSLAELLAERQATMCFISPKILRYFQPKHDALRLVFTGSERVSGLYSDKFTLINGYGASETCGGVLFFPLDKAYDNTPVGKPFGDEAVYLLDEAGNEAEEGEICLAGDFASCYLNHPEESAKTFVENPFQKRDGHPRMVRTGDLGRRLTDGNILFLNRKDWMVKINGQRVEPGEIEAVLRKIDGVSDAAVKDFTDGRNSTFLVAYYVSKEKEPIPADRLRLALLNALPEYMVPAYFTAMEKLPLNASGKLDRSALPTPDVRSYQAVYCAPETPVQETLCKAFAEILGVDRVGLDDDFFAMGGDSIKAAGLLTMLSKLPLNSADLYAGKTVRRLSECLEDRTGEIKREKGPMNAAEAGLSFYPLTPMERGMYLEQKIDPDSVSYNLNIGFFIEGTDGDKIKNVVTKLFLSHEALHSRYGEPEGVPSRVIMAQAPAVSDEKAVSRKAFEALLEDPGRPFLLEQEIPARLSLYPIKEGGFGLHMQIHHIAFDGASAGIFVKELIAGLKGVPVSENTPDLYAVSVRPGSGAEGNENSLAFYDRMFEDGVPANETPIKGMRPKLQPLTDALLQDALDLEEIAALEEKARQFGVTLFELMLSVAASTLAGYCAGEDVVIGIPVNTRDPFSRDMVGMFVNTVPVRIKPKKSKTLSDYLEETAEIVRQATRACNVPFETLVNRFVQKRDGSRNPMFDMSMNYMAVPEAYQDETLSVHAVSPLQKLPRDLSLVIRRSQSLTQILLQYSSDLFDAGVMKNFLEQFREGLRQIAWGNAVCVRDIAMLPKGQVAQLKALACSAQARIPETLLHRMFERAASEGENRTALIACDRVLSFRELNESANRIAWSLMGLGVNRGDSIVLLLPRRSFYFAAVFGVMKAGAAFIPCDPEYPTERIRHIIDDSGAAFIVTTKEHPGDYPAGKNLDIDELSAGDRTDNPEVSMTGDDLAYLIYTSGSTGKPKGVELKHEGICNFCTAHSSNILYETVKTQVERMLAVTTVSFDLSLKDTLGILCNGKTVVFASETQMNDPRALTELISDNAVDAMNATPSRYLQYLEYEPFSKALGRLKLVMAGGEGFPKALLERLQGMGIPTIINTYGPTETTISSNMANLAKAEHVSVGRPLLNVCEYIVDSDGALVPRGVVGELYIGGPGVARGYRNLDAQTAERFVEYRGGRFYRSGDYARWDADGNVEILGRMDSQVKLRGLRIELSEITELMEAQPGISRAVAAVRKLGGQDQLCAWFTAEGTIDVNKLREALRQKLTAYMVPAAFMQMDSLPVTANGKTDMKALPEPEIMLDEIVEPQNDRQQKISDIVAEVLGHGNFGVRTELYAVGLTSLNSVALSIKLSEAFGVNVQVRDFREHDTVERLERLILNQDREQELAPRDEYAVTKIQEGIFYETQSHPGATIYNIPTLLALDEAIDILRLKHAIVETVAAHPYLKVRFFINDEGAIRQKRMDDALFTESDIAEQRCDSIEAVEGTLVRPFDLLEDALFRVALIYTKTATYLFLDVHHIICDGTGRAILLRDITRAYGGETLKTEQYSGYEAALLEEQLRAGEHYTKAKQYYTGLFDGCDADCIPLSDAPNPSASGGGTIISEGSGIDLEAIETFCARNGFTANAFFTAAFGYAIAQYCGGEDAVFTTVNNGRNDPRFSDSVSMFVKTYPVLCRIQNQSVAEYISEVSRQLLDSLTYDVYSFEEMSRELGIRADLMFAYQAQVISDSDTFCGLPCKWTNMDLDDAKASLEFQVYPHDGTVRYYCHYEKSLYTEDFAREFLHIYERVLSEMQRRDTLADIELIDSETAGRLDGFNATGTDYPITDIVSLFRKSAEKYAERPAVIFKDEILTYAEVDDISERIAGHLRGMDIGRGSVVSVLIPRNAYMTTASLGVLKSGAAYQPLDPTYPAERLSFMMRDADARLLIADESLLDKVPEYEGPVLLTKDIPALTACEPMVENPGPEDLFILLYTSGSTGTPKGVMLEHRNLANFCSWYREFYHLDETSRVAAYASYGFDAHMMDLYPALTVGAGVVIIEEEIRLDLPKLAECFNRRGITHSFMTTQVGRQFYTMANTESLKYLSIGGEALVPLQQKDGDPALYNCYGPTECTIFSTIQRVDRLYQRMPIGRPLNNYRCYVIDKYGHRLPPMVPGELLIAGRGVARGYLNRPDLTQKAFIPNPFDTGTDYARAYRTGDIVRMLTDGTIEFIGRNDGQVKVRGFRIELTEVEAVIRDFPGIADATVQAFEDEISGEKFIAAYVVSDEPVDVPALNAFILERKPPYMVPAVTMQLDVIPLNQNQKVNRKALPKPQRQIDEIIRPQNEIQQKIFECVAEVVGHTDFGITTSLYEAGLSSIGTIRLNVLLYRAFDATVSARDLKSNDTVEKLEAFILAQDEEDAFERLKEYPITGTQAGVFVETRNHPGTTIYNIPTLLVLDEAIDTKRLKVAIAAVVNAHSYIKTRFFINGDGEIRQRRMDSMPFAPENIGEIECEDIDEVKDSLVVPFNLLEDALFRFSLVYTPKKNYLFMDIHHIVNDGTSQGILLSDISRAYAGEALTPERYTGYEAALLETRMRGGENYQKAKEYYSSLFSEVEVNCLPVGDADDACEGSGIVLVNGAADPAVIDAYCERNGVSRNAFYTAAFGYAIAKFCDREDAVFTTINNGRNDPRFSESVCMFVKTYPVLCRIEDRPIRDYIAEVSRQLMDSLTYDVYSFAEISSDLGISADLLFAWQDAVVSDDDTFCGKKCPRVPLSLNEAKATMELSVYPWEGKNVYRCEFRRSLYSEEFIHGFLHAYDCVLESFLRGQNLADIELLDGETAVRLDGFNATETDYPVTDIVTLFRESAEKYAEQPAVIFKDKILTYAQVDDITERIAGHLRDMGIGRGSVVSVLIPRNDYIATASLGILKSGAAYQPLDPAYPTERLSFMMQDADARLLIADESLLDKVPEYEGPVLLTKDIPSLPACEPMAENPGPEDLFILLYTSGSTGTPKGVMLEHGNLANFCSWYREYFHLDETSCASAYASYGFDCHMLDLYPTLTVGASVVIIEEDIRLDLLKLAEYFNRRGITHSFMTTQVGRQFYSMANTESLKYLSVAGEALVPLQRKDGDPALYNCYGPTECTVFSTAQCVDRLYQRMPIGKPLNNYKCYVIDKYGHRLPPMVPGELLIAGRGVARGYLNRPDLTQKAFIPNPFDTGADYARAYHTGDIVRMLTDGTIEFIGRNDGQVKVRGFRIELTEVEAVIRDFPGIADATVQAFEDETSGEKFIAAYVVSGEPVDVSALNAFILERKPSYMVPAVTMQLDVIPLNQNQKVNRKALPKPVFGQQTEEDDVSARPMTRFEEEIAAVLQKPLGDIAFSPTVSLTRYGLTSISAIGVVATLAKRFQVEIPVQELIGGWSIVDIENHIFQIWMREGFPSFAATPEVTAKAMSVEKRKYYPLTPVQLAVYYDAMKRESASTLYNIPMCLAFRSIDGKRLTEAVKEAIRAHSYINTHFELRDGRIVQVRADEKEPDVAFLEMTEEAFLHYKDDFVLPFNLTTGPLYHMAVVRVDGGETYLMMDIHHLVFDGLSTGVFIRDIGRAYGGEVLKPSEYTFFEYALEEEAKKGTPEYDEAQAYFDRLMKNYEAPSEIPPDRSKAPENGGMSKSVRTVGREKVDLLCRELEVTPSALFLGAVFYTVSRFQGSRQVYISTLDSGRSALKLHPLLGMFVHTLPIAMDLERDMTVQELITASADVLRASVRHEIYPFAEFAAKYGYTSRIMYEYQVGVMEGSSNVAGVPFESVPMNFESPKFPVSLTITEDEAGYVITVRYNNALYQDQTMEALAAALKVCVEYMVSDKTLSVRKLSLLDDTEEKIVNDFSTTGRAELPEKIFHRVFEAHAEKTPEHTAVIASDRTLSYAELNSEANRVASSLMARGIGKGGSAVLLLPRRSFYFSAMFGVLKTGAAFIPCDPEYPPERIRHILHDSGASCIITTSEHLADYTDDAAVDIRELLMGEDRGNPDVELTGEDMAYMIYTSGSTGKPKGVMMKHVCVVNCVYPHPVNEHYHVIKNRVEAILGVTSVSFDMSFQETAGALLNGKTLVFANETELNDPRALTVLFERTGANAFDATPSRLMQYMEYAPFCDALSRCCLVMVGGEGVPTMLLENLQKVLQPDAHIENTYGPTETTMACNGADMIHMDHVVAGKPLLNYESYIVDMDCNRLPRRVIGELLIGGVGVGIGYRNLPKLTEKKFINWEGKRVYRSGDYARWDSDGNVEILGRIDDQVKLRGLRIELSEITELMEAQPGIRRAVAAVRNINGQDNLCAWFSAEQSVDIVTLREEMKRHLTAYMVPVGFAQLPELPMTPNGKVDMKALVTPQPLDAGEYVPPANETERFFCEIFQKVLGIDRIGATDDFFTCGGTSLTATGVMVKASEADYPLKYGDLFKYKTPRLLAALFSKEKADEGQSASKTIMFDKYDYTRINEVLKRNTFASFNSGESRPIGNILLTGATGYMGMHVLAEYLRSESGKVWCIVRKGKFSSAYKRLRNVLFYYFQDSLADMQDRIEVIDGDVTDYAVFKKLESQPVDTVFNCAANVKHFSSGTDIEDINVGGTENALRFCLTTGARLIHFSTTSVAGHLFVSDPSQIRRLDEQSLYFGQITDNQYISSKLMSERIVLEAVAQKGADAKIIRVGALSARESDGEFQINFLSNSSMGQLRSFSVLKSFPYTMMNRPMCFGPIDTSARSFMHLARTPRECCLFHAVNNHTVPTIDVIRVMQECGIEIKVVENAVFLRDMEAAEQDPRKLAILSSILAYKDMAKGAVPVDVECEFTNQVLARTGFFWNATDGDYIRRFIKGLAGLGFFDEDNLTR